MLGASPGASTAVSIMVHVLERCFAPQLANGWEEKLKAMIPTYGHSLIDNPQLAHSTRAATAEILNLQQVAV